MSAFDEDGTPLPRFDKENSNAAAGFLKQHEAKDLARQVEALKSIVTARDEEIVKLKQLTDKGALLKDNQKMNNFIADLRNENVRLQEELGNLPLLKKQLHDYEVQFDSVKNDTDIRVLNAEKMVTELKIKYDEQTHLIRNMEDLLEEKELKLQGSLNEMDKAISQSTEYSKQLDDQRKEVQRLRDGTHLEILEERMQLLQSTLEAKNADYSQLQAHYFTMASQNEELIKQNDIHKKSISAQVDKAVAGIQSELAELKIRNAQLLTDAKDAKEQSRRLEVRIEESHSEMFDLQNQLTQYEHGLGVRDTMEKLRKLKVELQERDRKIAQFGQDINEKDRHIYTIMEDWRRMRKSLGLNDKLSSQDIAISSYHKEMEKIQGEVAFLNTRVENMETERRKLLEDLRKQMIVTNETGFRFYGLSSDNMNLVVTYAESLRDGTNVMPLNDASRKLLAELEASKSESSEYKMRLEQALIDRNNALDQLKYQKESSDRQYQEILIQLNDMKSNRQQGSSNAGIDSKTIAQLQELIQATTENTLKTLRFPDSYAERDGMSFRNTFLKTHDQDLNENLGLNATKTSFVNNAEFSRAITIPEDFENDERLQEKFAMKLPLSTKNIPINSVNNASRGQRNPLTTPLSSRSTAQNFVSHTPSNLISQAPKFQPSEFGFDELQVIPTDVTLGAPSAVIDPPEVFQKRLFGCLKQLLVAEKDCEVANDALNAQNVHSTQLISLVESLYSECISMKSDFETQRLQYVNQVDNLQKQHENDVIALRICTQSLKTMSEASLEDQITRMAVLTEQSITSEIDRQILQRRIKALSEELALVRTTLSKTEKNLIDCDRTAQNRVAQLNFLVSSSLGRVNAMQEVEKWVSRDDFTKLMTAHESICARYRELMVVHEKASTTVASARDWHRDNIRLQQELDDLEIKYEETVLKGKKFDAIVALSLGDSNRQAALLEISPSLPTISDTTILQSRIVSLQINEQTAMARAIRAQERFETLRQQFEVAEHAARDVESQLKQVQNDLIKERDSNLENRRLIESHVSYEKYNTLQSRVATLEASLSETRARMEQQRLLADVSTRQVKELNEKVLSSDAEMSFLRTALTDFEQRSDDNLLIGRLERECMTLKIDKKQIEREIETLKQKLDRADALVIRAEIRLEEDNAKMFRLQNEARRTLAQYRIDAGESKLQLTHLLSIEQADELRQSNTDLMKRIDKDREWKQKSMATLYGTQLELATLKLNLEMRAEFESLFSVDITEHKLKQKVLESKKEVRAARLKELEFGHRISIATSEIEYHKDTIVSLERTINRLQAKLVEKETKEGRLDDESPKSSKHKSKIKRFESEWENSDLMKFNVRAVSTQTTISPGMSQSLLDDATTDINKSLNQELQSLRTEVGVLTEQVRHKEKIIDDLRALLQQQLVQTETAASSGSSAVDLVQSVNSTERQQILNAASEQIRSFQLLVDQKNKAIASYKKLIAEQQENFSKEKARDQLELSRMSEIINKGADEKMLKMKSAIDNLERIPTQARGVVGEDEVSEIIEMKDRKITLLMIDFEKAQNLARDLEQNCLKYSKEIDRLNDTIFSLESKLKAAPSAAVVKAMKTQLNEKEERLEGLQSALKQLKEEMLSLSVNKVSDEKKVNATIPSDDGKQAEAIKISLNKKIQNLQSQLQTSKERADVAESQLLKDLTSLSERYKDEAKKSEKQNALLLSKLQKCDAKLSELEKEVLNNMFDFLMQKTGHVCSAALNSVLEQDSKKYEQQISQLRKKYDDLITNLELKDKEKEILREKIKFLEQDKASLNSKVVDTHQASVPAEIIAAKDASRLMELREALSAAEDRIVELNKKVRIQEELLKQKNDKYPPKFNADAAERDFSDELNTLRDHNLQIQSELFELKVEHSYCEEKLKRKVDLYAEAQQLIHKQNVALTSAPAPSHVENSKEFKDNSKWAHKRAEIEILAKENSADLLQFFDSLKNTADSLREENSSLVKDISKYKHEIETLKTSNTKYMEIVNQNKKMKLRLETLESNIKSNEEKLSHYEKEYPRISSAYEQAVSTIKKSENEVKKLQLKVQNNAIDMADLRLKLQAAENNFEALQRESNADRLRSSRVISESSSMQNEVNQKRLEIEKLNSEILELKSKVATPALVTNTPSSGISYQELKAENDALRNELSAFDEKFFDEIMELKYKHEELKKVHSELILKLKHYEK